MAEQLSGRGNGLGVFVETGPTGAKYFYHMGDNPGYKTFLMANDRGDAVAIMTDSDTGDSLNTEIFDVLAHDWPDAEAIRSPSPPPPLTETEVARWVDDLNGGECISTDAHGSTYTMQISKQKDGSVSMQPSWGGPPYTLYPINDTQACYREHERGLVEILQFSSTDEGSKSFTFLHGEWIKK